MFFLTAPIQLFANWTMISDRTLQDLQEWYQEMKMNFSASFANNQPLKCPIIMGETRYLYQEQQKTDQ